MINIFQAHKESFCSLPNHGAFTVLSVPNGPAELSKQLSCHPAIRHSSPPDVRRAVGRIHQQRNLRDRKQLESGFVSLERLRDDRTCQEFKLHNDLKFRDAYLFICLCLSLIFNKRRFRALSFWGPVDFFIFKEAQTFRALICLFDLLTNNV